MEEEVEFILRLLQKYNFTNSEAAFKEELLAREREGSSLSSSDSVPDWGVEVHLDDLQTADPLAVSDQISRRELHAHAGGNVKQTFLCSSRSPPEMTCSSSSLPGKHSFLEYGSGKSYERGLQPILSEEFAFDNLRIYPEPATVLSPSPTISNSVISVFQFGSGSVQDHAFPTKQNSGWVDRSEQDEHGEVKGLQKHLMQESHARHLSNHERVTMLDKEMQSRELLTGHSLDGSFLREGMLPEVDRYRMDLSPFENDIDVKSATKGRYLVQQSSQVRVISDITIADASRGDDIHYAVGTSNLDSFVPNPNIEKGACHLKTSFPLGLVKDSQYNTIQDYKASSHGSVSHGLVTGRELEQQAKGEAAQGSELPTSGRESVYLATMEGFLREDCAEIHGPEHLARLSSRSEELPTLPMLPHIRLRSMDRDDPAEATESSMWDAVVGSSLSEDMSSTGLKWPLSRPSVSQGIVEDMPDLLSGFATAADEGGFPDNYCDSDSYDDDDDPGYHRQPIEDEEWFYAHEIDYPSDDERAAQRTDKNSQTTDNQVEKLYEDDKSLVEEEAYFSGEEFYKSQAAALKSAEEKGSQSQSKRQVGRTESNYADLLSGGNNNSILSQAQAEGCSGFSGTPFDNEEVNRMRFEPAWQGFIGHPDELKHVSIVSTSGALGTVDADNAHHGSVRSSCIALSRVDAADVGSELRDGLVGSQVSSEVLRDQEFAAYRPGKGNFHLDEIFHRRAGNHFDVNTVPVQDLQDEDDDDDEGDMILHFYNEEWDHTHKTEDRYSAGIFNKLKTEVAINEYSDGHCFKNNGASLFEGFSFPSPASTGDIPISRAGSGKSLWSNRGSGGQDEETDGCGSGIVGPDDTLAVWKQKNDGVARFNDKNAGTLNLSALSGSSSEEYVSLEAREDANDNSYLGCLPKSCQRLDQDGGPMQEDIRLSAVEDDYEVFDLRIIHRKNRTGFEEEKDLPVVINTIIAGRYHVTEYLGSAAFSKAVQAHDLHTGMDVCMKIIKNNKDFFDQSLDEIKLLKFVNKHDPMDKYHILRLYDYFYHREHLFIVCELLRANLYEFHKFNRESGGEVYFTMPRLQSITRQCLEALGFLHKLGIIHCDLKPENILVKSYSRCEIKIIDLGSSCFQTDHLCSYVQSRSYRAPEVILGLPYDQKIDIWSLGCILAELCSGNVLFQNDSLATLLARVVGILGPIDPEVLAKGKDTHKYFTKNHTLYEKNQETEQLEYLLPKRTSLRHRLPMGDQGFVEFVGYLLQHNPVKRPTASEALKHRWLSYRYEPIPP